MLKTIAITCVALAGFGFALERPSSEAQARHRRCCGYSRHHCGNGCGYQQYSYGNCCSSGFAYQQSEQSCGAQGCSANGCSAGGCQNGGCSVQNGSGFQGPTTYNTGYGPTDPNSDSYGNQPNFQTAPPPPPAPAHTTFEQRGRVDGNIDANTNVRGNVTVPSPAVPPAPVGARVDTPPVEGSITPPTAPAAPTAPKAPSAPLPAAPAPANPTN